MNKRIFLLVLIPLLLVNTVTFAAPETLSPKRIIALAVHIDNGGMNISGLDLLKSAVTDNFQEKFNSYMANSVLTSSGVLEGLKKWGVDNLEAADPKSLAAYGRENNTSYIVLVTLRTASLSLDVKAFDVAKEQFTYQSKPADKSEGGFWPSALRFSLNPLQFISEKIRPLLDNEFSRLFKILNK